MLLWLYSINLTTTFPDDLCFVLSISKSLPHPVIAYKAVIENLKGWLLTNELCDENAQSFSDYNTKMQFIKEKLYDFCQTIKSGEF